MKGVTGEMAIFMGETVRFTAFVTWVASGGGVFSTMVPQGIFLVPTSISPETAATTGVNNVTL